MAKKAKATKSNPATADADAAANNAAAGAETALVQMLLSRVDAMQTSLATAMENITSASRSAQSTQSAIATKQDVGGDESQSAGISLASDNARTRDNFVLSQMIRFADRDRTQFDNMQAMLQVALSQMIFATSLSQNLAVVDSHQQHGKNADWRAASVPSRGK